MCKKIRSEIVNEETESNAMCVSLILQTKLAGTFKFLKLDRL